MSLTRARIVTDHVADASLLADVDLPTDMARLAALRQVALLDTPAEDAFDRLTRLASSVLRAPVSLISLVDEDRQFFKSCVGLQEPFASTRETPLSHSFCQYAVASREPLVVEDARTHPLLQQSPAIADLGMVAYAGVPLITSEGHALGTLCVIDTRPRRWTEDEVSVLRDLAAGVMTEIALRHALLEREAREAVEARERVRAQHLSTTLAKIGASSDLDHVLEALVGGATRLLGGQAGVVHVIDPHSRVRLRTLDLNADGSIAITTGRPFPPGSFSAALAAGGDAILVEDFWSLDPATYPLHAQMQREGMRSAVIVPIDAGAQRIGSLHINHSQPGYFTPHDLALAEALVAHTGAAIERARVDMERRQTDRDLLQLTRRLRLLLQVAIDIGPSLKLDAPLDTALRSLVEALPETDTAAVLLHDPETDVLVPRAYVGLGDAYGRIRLLPGEGISGAAFQRGAPVRHSGADSGLALHAPLRPENVALLAEDASGTRPKFGYSISVPLRTPAGGTVGALTLGSHRADYSDDDLQLLEGMASQVAVALDNDRLYKQVRQQANDLTVALNQLKQAQARVVQQERLRALGQLAGGIAHDLNNTLAPVVGFSELLQVTGAPSMLTRQQREWLELIRTGAKDAAEVVRRLREFYRPRDAQEPLGPVDLAQIVEQTIAFTRPKWKDDAQARGRTISLGTDLPPAPLVNGNSAELREALTNLVFNAVDALPEGGTITIRTRNEGQRVLLEVLDTGIGMPEHVRQRCLEPFYSTKGSRGTGLGLAMVHGTVERHQGQLEIESAPGEGTIIRLRLPVFDNEEKPPAPTTPLERIVPLSVLVIDDEPAVRAVVAAMLTAEGHTVIQAATGHDGIERMAEGNVDLVVTDRAMPGGISGEQVARAVKQCAPETPVILLTGYGDLMAAAGEHPPDIDTILSKPVSLGTLRSTIASLHVPATPGERQEGPRSCG